MSKMEEKEVEVLDEYEFVEEKQEPKKEEKSLPRIYVGYTSRITIGILLVVITSILTIYFSYHAFKVGDLINIRYHETTKTDYKILNSNQEEIIKEDKMFNSNDINSISFVFEYFFKNDKDVDIVYENQLIGDLYIKDKNNPDKIYYQDSYELSEKETNTWKHTKEFDFKNEVTIDYREYNSIAKKYSESYGVETDSYIEITNNITYKNKRGSNYKLSGDCKPSIVIPLNMDTIHLEVRDFNSEKRVNEKPPIILNNPLFLGIGIVFGIIAILSLAYISSIIYQTMDSNKSLYDRTIEKILKKYKRKIKTIDRTPSKKGKKTVRVKTIEELNDIRARLKTNILYNVINEHTKCEFYVIEPTKMYILTIKEVDLEKKINK